MMLHFFINPTSSSGAALKTWEILRTTLDKEQTAFTAHMLKGPGDATKVAQMLTSSGEEVHLVVVGGDGTLNEVLNGIQDFQRTKLSCIKSGSGNDFARSMKIPPDPQKALLHLLHHPEETSIEYGVATYIPEAGTDSASAQSNESVPKATEIQRRFLISCGVGYDADICFEVERSPIKAVLNRIHLGKLVYLTVGLKQIFFRRPVKGSLTLYDNDNFATRIPLPGGLFLMVGMIQPMEGGGVPFCPDADPTDGKLSVCLITHMPKWKLLPAVMLVYLKKHFIFSNITAHSCVSLEIETEQPQWIHLDGDAPCQVTHIRMQNQKALRFVK